MLKKEFCRARLNSLSLDGTKYTLPLYMSWLWASFLTSQFRVYICLSEHVQKWLFWGVNTRLHCAYFMVTVYENSSYKFYSFKEGACSSFSCMTGSVLSLEIFVRLVWAWSYLCGRILASGLWEYPWWFLQAC